MTRRTYSILLTPEPDDSAYNVTVPALPGCLTWGPTVEEARTRSQEASELWIESLVAHGEPVPTKEHPPRLQTVAIETTEPVAIRA